MNLECICLSTWKLDPLGLDFLGSLGIEPALPIEKLYVQKINPYAGAAVAGIKAGDTLLAMDSQPITDRMTFLRELKPHVGQLVRLTGDSDGTLLHSLQQC